MKGEKIELMRGSGNVFCDLGRGNADVEQLKALLAAEIIRALDREKLTVRAAHARTGFAAADFSRIRNADLARFTADRLMSMLNRLGSRVEVKIRVRRGNQYQTRRRDRLQRFLRFRAPCGTSEFSFLRSIHSRASEAEWK